ncbi:MAG: integrase catalytic domain-containing protein [Synergistes sp.]|nr:integrase catalytic domain-containing protein [Synergistes sp.]
MANTELSESRRDRYKGLKTILQRFEMFKQLTTTAPFALDVATFDENIYKEALTFMRDERLSYELFPQIYEKFPIGRHPQHKERAPEPRASNTVSCLEGCLRAFFTSQRKAGKIEKTPFENVERIKEEYLPVNLLTKEERDIIMKKNLWEFPALMKQRDIFIFQCLTGCRVSDLNKLTPDNIKNGVLVYVAKKTGEYTRVPLHPIAAEIVKRYEGNSKGRLLPFITPQRYNDAIKSLLTVCGIDRPVPRRNPDTGQPEMRKLCEVASSHLARRTFIGILYKEVKDPNIISKMSGHVEGSKAFSRYRDIDDDILKETINKYL